MLPGVIGTVKTAFLRLDNCVDAIGIGSGNGNADLAEDSSGKSVVFEMFISNAVVLRAIQAAALPAAGEKPRLSSRLPVRREDDVRIIPVLSDNNYSMILLHRINYH